MPVFVTLIVFIVRKRYVVDYISSYINILILYFARKMYFLHLGTSRRQRRILPMRSS
jgi:hypothetical protein